MFHRAPKNDIKLNNIWFINLNYEFGWLNLVLQVQTNRMYSLHFGYLLLFVYTDNWTMVGLYNIINWKVSFIIIPCIVSKAFSNRS